MYVAPTFILNAKLLNGETVLPANVEVLQRFNGQNDLLLGITISTWVYAPKAKVWHQCLHLAIHLSL